MATDPQYDDDGDDDYDDDNNNNNNNNNITKHVIRSCKSQSVVLCIL